MLGNKNSIQSSSTNSADQYLPNHSGHQQKQLMCVCQSIMAKGLSGKRTVHEGHAGGTWTLMRFHIDNAFGSIHLFVCTSLYLGLWDLRCALLRRYRTTLCTSDHGALGRPTSVRSGGRPPNIFNFLVVHKEHAQNGHFLSAFHPSHFFQVGWQWTYTDGAQGHGHVV